MLEDHLCNYLLSNESISIAEKYCPIEVARDMTVCFFGDYDVTYPREAIMIKGLNQHHVRVLECNCSIKYKGPKTKNKLIYIFKAYSKLVKKFWPIKKQITHMIVPHNNHLIVPLAYCLAKIFKFQLIVDAFDPAYHTALLIGEKMLTVKVRYCLEKLSLNLADKILVETLEFKKLYIKTYNLQPNRIFPLPVGAIRKEPPEIVSSPLPIQRTDFVVLYWGNFHKHHGLDTIIEAAAILQKHGDIKFLLAGNGIEYNRVSKLVQEKKLTNVCLLGYLTNDVLSYLIKNADVCLGIFSRHELALCSLTNKVLEAMALKKAVITERSPATLAMLRDQIDVLLVPPEDSYALTDAILHLKQDSSFRSRLEQEAYKTFLRLFSEDAIGRDLINILEETAVEEVQCG